MNCKEQALRKLLPFGRFGHVLYHQERENAFFDLATFLFHVRAGASTKRSILSRKIANFEVVLKKKVMELRLEFEQQILVELTPEQRRKATDLLGPPFNYNDMDEEITSFKRKYEELKSRKAGK